MARIAGVDLPEGKRLDIGLTYIYGIGRANVKSILEEAKLDPAKRVKDLTEGDINVLTKALEKFPVEGELRQIVDQNIKRMIDNNSYVGSRHRKGLPVRGQRTRSNARTKRGKRVTIGAMRKDVAAKMAPKPAEGAK